MTGNTIGWITYSILKNVSPSQVVSLSIWWNRSRSLSPLFFHANFLFLYDTHLITRKNLFLFFANMPGFLLSVWFNLCAAKLQYQDHYTKEIRKSIVHYLEHEEETKSQLFCKVDGTNDDNCIEGTAKEQNQPSWKSATDWGTIVLNVTAQITPAPAPHETMVIVIVIIWTAIVGIVGLVNSLPMSTRELIVGISVNINLCFFYGAPLSSIAQVCRDRTSESIHIATMVTNILNSCFWTIYGIAILDAFIYVPNGLGAILGFLQVGMVLLFPRKRTSRSPPRTEENALNSSKHRPETTPDIARSANDQVTIPAGCSDKLEGL